MRSTRAFAVMGLLALAGCASPSNTPAPAAQVAANGQAAADAQDPTAAAVKKPKTCIVGTRVCSKDQQLDPAVSSMDGVAFGQMMQGHQVGGQMAPN